MKVDKEKLLSALEQIKPGLTQKDIIEQANCYAFLGDRIATYNDDIAVSVPTDIMIKGAIIAKEFHTSLSKLKGKEIEAGLHNNELQMHSKRTKIGIKFDSDIKLPLNELGKIKKWEKIPDGLLEGLEFCMFSVSSDMSEPKFTCLYVENSLITSTDRFRVTRYTFDGEFKESALIPASNVVTLVKYPVTKYAKTEGWIHFKTDTDLIFSSRIYSETFDETSKFFKVKGDSFTMPKQIIDALDRVEVFGKSDIDVDSLIKVSMGAKKITLRGESKIGWAEEIVKAKFTGQPFTFNIHPQFLRDILSRTKECITDGDRLLFEGENFKHVVSLMEE